MKKAFDQTVRDIKREVNKKVLKVPSIEQKVLDATSNEPWGPHGSHLSDIAQATRNYHEYQMIMSVIWKRINDTGKNWRHVYKALTVLEYLVAHGSERVIDEIREHAYQISTLSDFQYIDSSGRDQGSNVRKKSQSLVVLVNDKERIQEVRQKAAANRDKYRNTSGGGMYRPGGYDDDRNEGRYGSRDEDRNGYGREREWGYRDDDRSGRYGDSYSRDGDRYGREYEERYGRDGFRDDDYRGRSRSVDDYHYGSRSRSSDRERDRAYEDDGQYSSSRGSGAKADDRSQDGSVAGRRLDRKFSEQNLGAPPSYEEAVGEARSPVHSERDGETSSFPPKSSSPTANTGQEATSAPAASVAPSPSPSLALALAPVPARAPAAPAPAPAPAPVDKEVDGFDEFDPRGPFSAAPTTSNGSGMDLLGSLSDSFSSNSLALVPATTATTTSEADAYSNAASGNTFVATQSASTGSSQPFDDPFGDGPFRAIPSTNDVPARSHSVASTSSFNSSTNQNFEPLQSTAQKVEAVNNFGFGETFSSSNTNPPYQHQDQSTDLLADILPPSGPSPPMPSQAGFPAQSGHPASQTGFPSQVGQPSSQAPYPPQAGHPASAGFPAQMGQPPSLSGFPAQGGQPAAQTGFPSQIGLPASQMGFPSQVGPGSQAGYYAPNGQPAQQSSNYYGGYQPQSGSAAQVVPPMAPQAPTGQHNASNFLSQSGFAAQAQGGSQMGLHVPQAPSNAPVISQSSLTPSTGALAIVPQPTKDKFETKSTVWTDTLNRGLVNLNISGPKTNPLADIGVDFEAINRREKRMEKPSANPVVSNVSMGKAMGSGSGIGRAGAGALRAPPNPTIGSGMGMGMGSGSGAGFGMGGYGGASQPMGGMGMNMPVNMGPGMNMGMGQGVHLQPPTGFPPGSTMPGGFNPMMGRGGYGQQPYGGGYR
ncbi:hypothetical protein RJ639_007035 [Escallonia herrerae]|uniref:ENTH domain-containing protein n=1 Tax=Escallonia herrerae TaxID=1293975 RepID=A0AA88W0L2_9ASTE|nr:hypothetical protein RJ639_007035 [Escallonia herrerae]